tara:strand:+ start:637 stop:1062 length:426 start_codon:yes stop_codon:yes gene_type:complete
MIAALLPILTPVLSKVIDSIFPDKEAADTAKLELMRLQQNGELKEIETQMSAIVMEAKSDDPWTSRARPSFLYVMYAVIILCFVGGIGGIWWPVEVTQASMNIRNLLTAIPEQMWWLFGTGYLGYAAGRSWDKKNIMEGKK